MAATVHHRRPGRVGAPRRRVAIGTAAAPLAATALLWPALVAWPLLGGPFVALAVGVAGWSFARAAAPLRHANDNALRPVSRFAACRFGPAVHAAGGIATGAQGDGRTIHRDAAARAAGDPPLRLADASDAAG